METYYFNSMQGNPCADVQCIAGTVAQVERNSEGYELWLFDPWQYRASGGKTVKRKTLKGAQSALVKHTEGLSLGSVTVEL